MLASPRPEPYENPRTGSCRRQAPGEHCRLCNPLKHSTCRADVIAAAHSHSLYGKAWASLGRPLDPITQDECAFFEDHVVFDDFTGVVYETSEGERIAKALLTHKAAILRNHGLLTVGHTVDEAAWWFITMDRSCHAQLLAEEAGQPILINRECALATRQQVGTDETGWFQFQPLWQMITHEQPDLLDSNRVAIPRPRIHFRLQGRDRCAGCWVRFISANQLCQKVPGLDCRLVAYVARFDGSRIAQVQAGLTYPAC